MEYFRRSSRQRSSLSYWYSWM